MYRTTIIALIFTAQLCIMNGMPVGADEKSDSYAANAEARSFFLIGNSLTWDTVPARLDGDTQWHVDCGKSLPYIVEHPSNPCVKSSTLWPAALKQKQYDIISLQVHYGSVLEEDVAAIGQLIQLQPEATIVIHTGWARSAELLSEWNRNSTASDSPMLHHISYFKTLLNELKERHPSRTIRRTRAMDLLAQIEEDIDSGSAPLKSVDELYRDKIHMNVITGRYLMHNSMRLALSQKTSAAGFEKLDPELRTYFDDVLSRVCSTATQKSE